MELIKSPHNLSLFQVLRCLAQISISVLLLLVFLSTQYLSYIALVLFLSFLWLINQNYHWRWLPSVVFTTQIMVIVAGLLLDFAQPLLILATVIAISAWDLDVFDLYLREENIVKDRHVIESRHIKRLLLIDGFGLCLTYLAMNLSVGINFTTAVILSILAILGLTTGINFFNKSAKTSFR